MCMTCSAVAVAEVAINSIDHNIQLQQHGTLYSCFIVTIILIISISALSSGSVPLTHYLRALSLVIATG